MDLWFKVRFSPTAVAWRCFGVSFGLCMGKLFFDFSIILTSGLTVILRRESFPVFLGSSQNSFALLLSRIISDLRQILTLHSGGGLNANLERLERRAPIKNEWTNGLKNVRGSVAMARPGGDPDSATSQVRFYKPLLLAKLESNAPSSSSIWWITTVWTRLLTTAPDIVSSLRYPQEWTSLIKLR